MLSILQYKYHFNGAVIESVKVVMYRSLLFWLQLAHGSTQLTLLVGTILQQVCTMIVHGYDIIVLTPVAGSDYGTSTGRQMYSVTFPVGSQSQSFSVNTLSDNVYEFNETFSLIIQPSSTLGLTTGSPMETEVTITDTTGWQKICYCFYNSNLQFSELDFLPQPSWALKCQDRCSYHYKSLLVVLLGHSVFQCYHHC